MNEREAFEAWFKEKSPVGGINAKLAARDAWLARAAVEADRAQRVPDVEDLKYRLVAISSAVADSDDREAQAIIRTTLELLASTPAPAQQDACDCVDPKFCSRPCALTIAQHQEPPQQERGPMTYEKDRALCEAFCNAASDEYFKARPQLDSDVNRRIFYAGHRKAWLEWQTAHGIKE